MRHRHTTHFRVIQVRWLIIQKTICRERRRVLPFRRSIEYRIIRVASLLLLVLMLLKVLWIELKT